MKLDTKEKYDAWVLRKKRTKQPKNGPRRDYTNLEGHRQHGHGSKPNHHERYADIADCFPLLKVGHEEHNHPIEQANTVSKL